jgi:tetratricopeptide (TPR) repeat protein
MARRLNKRLLVYMLIFVGVPLAVLAWLALNPGVVMSGNPQQLFAEAMKAADAGDWTGAWSSIRKAVQAGGSRDPEYQSQLGRIALSQKPPLPHYAIAAWATALSLKPDHLDAQKGLAELYLRTQSLKEARVQCDRLIKLDPTFGNGYVWAAQCELSFAAIEKNDFKRVPFYEAAIARCREGVEKVPETLDLYRIMAWAYGRLEQPEEVDKVIDLAVAKNPTSVDACLRKAVHLVSRGRVAEVDAFLQDALKADKVGENAKLYLFLGELAQGHEGNPEKARGFFTKAVALDPAGEGGYLRLATMDRLEGHPEEALARLGQALQVPELRGSLNLRAEMAGIYIGSGNLEKADVIIEEISKAAPEAAVVSLLRGKRALRSMQVRQAITYLEQARDRQPTPQTSLQLSQAYLLGDELGLAQRELETLTRDQPGEIRAWQLLAETQFRLHEPDKAARSAQRVLDAIPNNTAMRMLKAQTLAMAKQWAEALKETQIAAGRDPENPDPLLLMAALHRSMNQPEEAEKVLRQALVVSKNASRVYQQLIRFYKETSQQEKVAPLVEEAQRNLPNEIIIDADNLQDMERQLKVRADAPGATPQGLMTLARLYQMTDRLPLAREYLQKAMAKSESNSADWRQAWQMFFLMELSAESYAAAADLIAQLKQIDPTATELFFADPLLAMSEASKEKAPEAVQQKLDEAARLLRTLTRSPQGRSLSQAYFLLGQVLVRQHKLDEATNELNKVLELRPTHQQARMLLGQVYLRLGNLDGAVGAAKEAIRFDPQFIPALELLANASAGLTDWAAASAAREEVRRLIPDNVNNLISLGALYVQRHMTEEAEKVFDRAYELDKDNSLLVRGLADFYADSGRSEKGVQLLDAYVGRHETMPEAWILRGEFAARVSGLAEAEKYYRTAAKLSPGDPKPLVALGDVYARANNLATAVTIYLQAVAVKPEAPEAKRHLADVYMAQGAYGQAQATIDEVLKADPKDAIALVVAGRIASREEKPDLARQYIEKALAIDPGFGEATLRLAELYVGSDPVKAGALLESIDPTDASFEMAMLMLADIDTRRLLIDKAIMDLQRLRDFRPVSIPGRLALASKYMMTNRPDKAAEVYQTLLRDRKGQDAGLLVSLADAQVRMSRFEDALANYEKAFQLKSDMPEALMGQAMCLVMLKKPAVAVQRVTAVLNDRPREVWPRLALAAVYERTNDLAAAKETIEKGLLARPEWEGGYVYLADLFQRPPKPDKAEARRRLEEGLARVPASITIRGGLALLEISEQRFGAARTILEPLAKDFERLYGTNPERRDKLRDYMMPMRLYALALYNENKPEEAVKWGRLLWAIDRTDVGNANNLAWVLAEEFNQVEEAEQIIQQCLLIVPNQPQVLDTAGWIAFLDNRYREATDRFQASIKYGDNAEAHYHYARLLEADDKPDEARGEYQRALEMQLPKKYEQDAKTRLGRLKG